jgi:hypothetical protein
MGLFLAATAYLLEKPYIIYISLIEIYKTRINKSIKRSFTTVSLAQALILY